MFVPTRAVAEALLEEASHMNPGPWVSHVRHVADAAQRIAQAAGMDAERAFVLGLTHDIGRREGVNNLRHLTDGYRFMRGLGYEDAARVCITHAYPINDTEMYIGKWDLSGEDAELLRDVLARTTFNDEDRLIQLCDALALPDGFCLLEKRFVDIGIRYGTPEFVQRKWRATLDIKDDFEVRIGISIYTLLPGIVENTFSLAR
jgi:HD domain